MHDRVFNLVKICQGKSNKNNEIFTFITNLFTSKLTVNRVTIHVMCSVLTKPWSLQDGNAILSLQCLIKSNLIILIQYPGDKFNSSTHIVREESISFQFYVVFVEIVE